MAIPVFHVRDLQASLAFYVDVLGWTVAWTAGEPAFYAAVTWNEHELQLEQGASNGSIAYLRVPEVNDVFAALVARGFVPPVGDEVHNHPTDQTWDMREFYVRAPDRNCLRFASELPN